MRTYLYQIIQVLLLITFIASCGNAEANFWKELDNKEKKLLDELANLYPDSPDRFAEIRRKIEDAGLKFRKALPHEKNEILFFLDSDISRLELDIKWDKNRLESLPDWYPELAEKQEQKIRYNQKLLQLYKLRRKYYSRAM